MHRQRGDDLGRSAGCTGPGRVGDLETTAVLARGIGRYGLARRDADRPTAAPHLKGELASVAVLPCCCDTFM